MVGRSEFLGYIIRFWWFPEECCLLAKKRSNENICSRVFGSLQTGQLHIYIVVRGYLNILLSGKQLLRLTSKVVLISFVAPGNNFQNLFTLKHHTFVSSKLYLWCVFFLLENICIPFPPSSDFILRFCICSSKLVREKG